MRWLAMRKILFTSALTTICSVFLWNANASRSSEDLMDAKDQSVRSLFNATVVSVHVNEKQWVNQYDLICVLERAKMTMNITAPHSGYIERIAVSPLNQIEKDGVLVMMAPTLPESHETPSQPLSPLPEPSAKSKVDQDNAPVELLEEVDMAFDHMSGEEEIVALGHASTATEEGVYYRDMKEGMRQSPEVLTRVMPKVVSTLHPSLSKISVGAALRSEAIRSTDNVENQIVAKQRLQSIEFTTSKHQHHIKERASAQEDLPNTFLRKGWRSMVLDLKNDMSLLKISLLAWNAQGFQRVCWSFVFALALLLAQEEVVVRRLYHRILGRFRRQHAYVFETNPPYEMRCVLNENLKKHNPRKRQA